MKVAIYTLVIALSIVGILAIAGLIRKKWKAKNHEKKTQKLRQMIEEVSTANKPVTPEMLMEMDALSREIITTQDAGKAERSDLKSLAKTYGKKLSPEGGS